MSALLVRYLEKLPDRSRPVLKTCVYGLAAGVVAVGFQLAITAFDRFTLHEIARCAPGVFLIGSFLLMMSTSLIAGYLLTNFCPAAAGSGVPQLKLAFWKEFGYVPIRVIWVKFVAGVLSIGGGSSLGREGPSVQLAGALSSNLAGAMGEPKQNRRLAAAAGAAAGLAAAFNTPLAAVTFVLEEIIADLNSRLLGGVLLASVIGAFVVHGLVGKQPAFTLTDVASPSWIAYSLAPFVAAVAALMGVVFQKSTLGIRARLKKPGRVPAWMRPAVGAFIAWVAAAAVFLTTGHMGVFGLGYDDLSAGLSHHVVWYIAGLLLATKLLATVTCYGFGGCGGIFSPTLFFGGMSGVFLCGLIGQVMHLSPADTVALEVVGMSACLGAVVRAPVTGILIVFEMTHEFSLVPALMIGALVSQAISHWLTHHNFYEELLEQDGHNLDRVIPPRDLQSWQSLRVSAITNFQPVSVTDLSAEAVAKLLEAHPYQRFPVLKDEQLIGVLTRIEGLAAVKEKRAPRLETPVQCLTSQHIRELQHLLIESTTLMVVIVDKLGGRMLGIVTLHDLLRAEVAAGKGGFDPSDAGRKAAA